MDNQNNLVEKLFGIRHQYGETLALQKKDLLERINVSILKSKRAIEVYNDTLLFLMAYPDNRGIYELAEVALNKLAGQISAKENIRTALYNSGLTGSQICADFSFEIVKWLRKTYGKDVTLDSFAAPDGQILSILSVVMPQVESEVLQDENSIWQLWMKKCTAKGDDLLDTFIKVFDQSPIRPEVKDELWTALGIYVTINLVSPVQLPSSLTSVHFHKSVIKKITPNFQSAERYLKVKLTKPEAEKIIDSARITLVRHLREIDPISFSDPETVSYYHLEKGLSIALFGMRTERRHPIDSYMGYMVFKNGLPFGYAGSWVLFDSARIGLNIFPSFRGGESQPTFEQILKVHKQVFHLNRFSADPYQIGKHNSDGIKSGAFWLYHKMGFRPIKQEQKQLAESEARMIEVDKSHRTSAVVLKKLADSRLEMNLNKKKTVSFDATDLSLLYNAIVTRKYGGDRKMAEKDSYQQLVKVIKPGQDLANETLKYVLNNWCVILVADVVALKANRALISTVKTAFLLKARGNEEEYIRVLQRSGDFRRFIEAVYSLYL